MFRKMTVWLLSILMCFSLMPISVWAVTGSDNSNIYLYTSKDCSMPQTGMAKTIFFLVDFPDYRNQDKSITAAGMQEKYYKSGNPNSLSGFYRKSSHNNLNIRGKVYGWYTTEHKRSYYSGINGDEKLYQEVLSYYDKVGINYRNYDGDGDGVVDCVYLLFAGGNTGYGSDWWSYAGYLQDESFCIDERQFGSYVKLAADDVQTAIHETGHALGLWDYYQIDDSGKASYGIGGHDIMDDNTGDHNALSKILLGWITPQVVLAKDLADAQTLSLSDQETGDCIVFFPDNIIDYGGEYYIIEYLSGKGYYHNLPDLEDGVFRVLHVRGTDIQGRLRISLVQPEDSHKLIGRQKWKSSDLFSSGMMYSPWQNHILFLHDAADCQKGILYFFPEELKNSTASEEIFCSTRAVLLKNKTAFSPVVTEKNGISVNKQLDWVSVNSEIAKVDSSGRITALSAGNTVVIGTRARRNGSIDVVVIYVYVVSKLNDISFYPKERILTPGKTTKMEIYANGVQLTQDLKARWSVSNSRLAVSQRGTVRADHVGNATVQAVLPGGIRLTYRFMVDFKPLKVRITADEHGSPQIRWNAVPGASGYQVYRYNYKTKNDPEMIGVIPAGKSCSYADTKVRKGTGYAYQVFAFDSTQSPTVYSKGSGWVNFKIK